MFLNYSVSWCLIVAALLVAATIFFSVTHSALRHIVWVKLQEDFSRRGRPERAQIVRSLLWELLSATSIWRLLCNLGLLLTVVYFFTRLQGGPVRESVWPFVGAFVVSGVVLSVFSVAIPHAWARYAGTELLVRCYPVLRFVERISWPLTTIIRLFDTLFRRLTGAAEEHTDERLEEKQEELLSVLQEGRKEGVVDEKEGEMIASILELRDTTAGEIMTPRTEVVGIDADATLAQTIDMVIREGYSRYPVYEQSIDRIVGMLYAKDLLYDLKQAGSSKDIRHLLRAPYFVPENKTLRDLLHGFQSQKVHLAVVLDEYGGTAGVVTFEDVLEELVGEIGDEYEGPQSETVRKIDDHTFEVDGRYHVDELNKQCRLNLPESEDYETIGGFVFSKLGYIPQSGETFEHDHLKFIVTDAGQRRVNRLRIVMTPSQQTTQD
jgi:putative hemolysin